MVDSVNVIIAFISFVRYDGIMGYFGKIEEKLTAISLRKLGYSYSQIQSVVPVSKSTLSIWCRDICLDKEQRQALIHKRLIAAKHGSQVAAKKKRIKKLMESRRIHKQAFSKLGEIGKRERFIAGIALYLGDGYKTGYRFGFSNADPRIIQFMMNWLLEFTDIKKDKIHGRIWLHDNLDEGKAKSFWSELLGINKANFIKSYVVKNKVNSNKTRKNIHAYGVFSLIVNSRSLQEEMIGFMTGILSN